jgi:hypothetical protein
MIRKIPSMALLVLVISGCSGHHISSEHTKSFAAKDIPRAWRNSHQDWLELKEKYQGNYSYERDARYSTDFNSSTKFEIISEQVEFRHFFEWQTGNSPSITWSESYADLDAHNQGSPSKTMDQLYRQCQSDILSLSQSKYLIKFKVDQFNILQECSYTQKKCDSNCTKGIRIQGLSMKG